MREAGRKVFIKDLGEGLVLRRATVADTEALVAFNVRLHCEHNPADVGYITHWTKDLLSGRHPAVKPRDFTIVEDTRTHALVSSLCLISQTWCYGGIEFGLGRPELVGTDPAYRKRGLVREQFEVIHEWSRARGELAQAITGIPYFYRQFGYEMTLDLDGYRRGHVSQIPKLKEGEAEPYRVRAATEADAAFLARTYRAGLSRSLVSCARPPAVWRHELNGRPREGNLHTELRVLETAEGKPVGMLAHDGGLQGDSLRVRAYELRPGTNWLAVTPSVLRYLAKTGEEYGGGQGKRMEWYVFIHGPAHPVYDVLGTRGVPPPGMYTYYMRVPDLPAFLRHIAPVLEQRLANSIAVGFSGELRLVFRTQHETRARLVFEKGKPKQVDAQNSSGGLSAFFLHHTFLHLLFGHRTLDELQHVCTDCGCSGPETHVLLEILFPKQASQVWPLG